MTSSTVPLKVPGLSAETVRLLRETFAAKDHHPSAQMWEGIQNLALCLQKMADGECDPKFYLSSLDPGVGKTQTIVHFLRALRASPKHDDVGVVVFFSTKQQIADIIRKIVEDAGLSQCDFAVLVEKDDKLNDLGSQDHSGARVLFTTQQRLQLVCRDGRDFSSVARYYFRDQPRQVRIWDEALLPAESVTVVSRDVGSLHRPLRRKSENIVEYLDALRAKVDACPDHGFFDVPDLEADTGLSQRQVAELTEGENEETKKLGADLWSLANSKVVIRVDGPWTGRVMVSIRENLPPDLAPVVILDASGRVRRTYRWWEHDRQTLVRLQSAPKRYDNLSIRVWNIGGGQASFLNDKDLKRRCDGIAATINEKPTEEWLVVCYLRQLDRMRRLIDPMIIGEHSRVKYLHWGNHKASNEYKDIKNIILAGTRFLPASAYEGIGRAARGLRPDQGELSTSELDRLGEGEIADAILQAVCRGVVRRCENDQCPPCDLYVIASTKRGVRELLPKVFSGCVIDRWRPEPLKLTGKAADLVNYVIDWFRENIFEEDKRLLFTEVRQAIGVSDAANFNKLRNQEDVMQALAENEITEEDSGQRARAYILFCPHGHIDRDDCRACWPGAPMDAFCPHGHIDRSDCPVCG